MGTPQIPSIDSDSKQFPDVIRQRLAANLKDPAAPEGAALGLLAPRSDGVRITAASLPTWTKKKQLALLGRSPARLLCVGDSTTAGVYSDSFDTALGSTNQGGPNSYPARLAAYLTARGIPAAVALAVPGHSGNDDSRWGGSRTYGGLDLGAGANASLLLSNSGHNFTFTSGAKADTYDVYFFGDDGTGVFTGTVSGGAATTVTTSGRGRGVFKASIKAASANAANVLQLAWTSGTNYILGVEFYDSTNPNVVRILPAGVGGSQANDWANRLNTSVFGGRAFIGAMVPDLTIVSLGINDDGAGRTTAQVLADMDTIASAADDTGDVLMMSAVPHAWASGVDAINAGLLASSYPYVDLAWRYGNSMIARGLMTQDGTHPNALGYGDIASVLARLL